ncbi:MAG TPA: 4a-hydroxytetrahydrobiopterin dehydratase [Ktedonobacterales bacterium]|jgi:4a-hydroxytetrahydrobiopterin dehydratase
MPRLSDTEIQQALGTLPGWAFEDGALRKPFTFPAFLDGIAFVNRVAALAEQANHHPDLAIAYTRITLTLATHDAGGVTEKDVDLARQIEAAAHG